MENILQGLNLNRFQSPSISYEESLRRSEQNKADTINATKYPDDETRIHCDICDNRGNIAYVSDETGKCTFRDCKCKGTRTTVKRLMQCGIWERARRCKLDKFITDTPFRRFMRDTVESFIADPKEKWLALLGQSGAGKTHLCTAAFVQITHKHGMAGEYMLWNADGRKLKANSMDDSDEKLWSKYKKTPLLYIDDLFKTLRGETPSSADIRMAFEILDYRYNNHLTTILSSEMNIKQLFSLDEAIAGRITEMCGPYLVSIETDPAKNWRKQVNNMPRDAAG